MRPNCVPVKGATVRSGVPGHCGTVTLSHMSDSRPAPSGAQTLARGIEALKAVALSPGGLTIQEVAARVGVHRSIASRLLQTLADGGLVARSADGRYRGGAGLVSLARSGIAVFRDAALPEVRRLSDLLQATITLFIEQGSGAHALLVETPRSNGFHLTISEGASFPYDRGAATWALRSLHPVRPDDSAFLTEVRQRGWARTFGEVEPGAYALAVPIPSDGLRPNACLAIITLRENALDEALEPMLEAAARIAGWGGPS